VKKNEEEYCHHAFLCRVLAFAVFWGLSYWMLSRLVCRVMHMFTSRAGFPFPVVLVFEETVYLFLRSAVLGFLALSTTAWLSAM